MSDLLNRIDDYVNRKKEDSLTIKEGFNMADLMNKMANFIYNIDPKLLDQQGKDIRSDIISAVNSNDFDLVIDRSEIDDDVETEMEAGPEDIDDFIPVEEIPEPEIEESKKEKKKLRRLTESRKSKR